MSIVKDQIIVFGIFFDARAKEFYGSLTNLVRHTFRTHFEEYEGFDKNKGLDGPPGPTGKQIIAKDPNVNLFWRNYRPEEVDFKEEDKPGADELFVAVAFDRFLNDNRGVNIDDRAMSILSQFKSHMIALIKERDERK